jgi:hypothetical protein
MRRMLFVLTSLGLLGSALGCYCMKGVCDCDYTPWGTPIVPINPGPAGAGAANAAGLAGPFAGYNAGATAYPASPIYAPAQAVPSMVPGGTKVEPIKEMPKADPKPMGTDTKKPTTPEE